MKAKDYEGEDLEIFIAVEENIKIGTCNFIFHWYFFIFFRVFVFNFNLRNFLISMKM